MEILGGADIPALGVVSREELRGLYWATGSWTFPRTEDHVIYPRKYVADSPLFAQLHGVLDPAHIADLSNQRSEFAATPTLEKCVAEAVYEEVRRALLPDAPSRLQCLFAAKDVPSALHFAMQYLPPPTFDAQGFGNIGATPVSTADGAWVALDMTLFQVEPLSGTGHTTAVALRKLRAVAENYWRGRQSAEPFVEVLAEKLWQWTAHIGS